MNTHKRQRFLHRAAQRTLVPLVENEAYRQQRGCGRICGKERAQ